MKEFDYLPTNEQLADKDFWLNIPKEGAIFEGYYYGPTFAITKDGEPMKLTFDNGKNLINQFPYELAVKEMQRLSKQFDNISIELNGYHQSYVKHKDHLSA